MASAQIKFYGMHKARNSTAIPKDPDDWLFTLEGDFKTPYNVLQPVVVVENPSRTTTHYGTDFVADPPNYASIDLYPHSAEVAVRYYWISHIVWISNTLVEVDMEIDVLATWADFIKASTQFVNRASTVYDDRLLDSRYPTFSPESASGVDIGNSVPWHMSTPWLGTGYFVVGIINDDNNAFGSVSYYMFDCLSWNYLRNKLMSTTTWTNMSFDQISESLYKSLFNPLQYIQSVVWFPPGVISTIFNDATVPLQHSLRFGWWSVDLSDPDISIGYKPLYHSYDAGSFDLSVRHHSESTTRGLYLNCPPFFNRILYMPPFDAIELDTSALYQATDYPVVNWYVDYLTGKASVRVMSHNQSGVIVGTGSSQLGVPMTVAQATQDMIGAIGGTFQAATGGVMAVGGVAQAFSGGKAAASAGNTVKGGFTNLISGAQTLADSIIPSITSEGVGNSIMTFGMPCLDLIIVKYASTPDADRFGRPYCRSVKLSTIGTGFVQCNDAHVEWSGPMLDEIRQIESYLDTGIYLETYPPIPPGP